MKKEIRAIGGFKMQMTQMGVITGNEILLRLARPATALFAVAAAEKHKTPTKEDVIKGLVGALQNLRPSDMRFIVQKFAECTVVWLPDGKTAPKDYPLPDHLDQVFAGNYPAELEWLRWGIELNRFFGSVLDRLSAVEDVAASKSDSPTASTGSSGASSAAPSA